jgi:hypothetical protein
VVSTDWIYILYLNHHRMPTYRILVNLVQSLKAIPSRLGQCTAQIYRTPNINMNKLHDFPLISRYSTPVFLVTYFGFQVVHQNYSFNFEFQWDFTISKILSLIPTISTTMPLIFKALCHSWDLWFSWQRRCQCRSSGLKYLVVTLSGYQRWDIRFSSSQVWSWLSSGILRCVIW